MIENDEALAKAAAQALAADYGEGLTTVVDKALKDELPAPSTDGTRMIEWALINNAASVVQLGMFLTVVAKWAWTRTKTLTDKTALKQAARAELKPPAGITGEQRDRVIATVIDKL